MFKNRLIFSIVTVSLCLFMWSPLHAGIYKWVDEDGQVHYGEKPGNTAAEEVTIRHNETTTPRKINKTEEQEAEGTGSEDTEKAGTETDKQEEWGEWKEVPPSNKEKRKLCKQAKSDLAAISSRGRMREINSKGEYVYLTEAQRQQRIATAKKNQKKYCR